MILIARSFGQLGNQLILCAHMIAAAREYGVSLTNPCFAQYAHLFPATSDDLWCRYPAQVESSGTPSSFQRRVLAKAVYLLGKTLWTLGLRQYPLTVIRLTGEELCDLQSDEFAFAVKKNRPLLVLGWLFRSQALLEKHADAVREHFRIAASDREVVDRLIARMRQQSDVIVGVHIRHGDYATFLDGRYYYSSQQYADAMRGIANSLPGKRVSFLVCSNSKLSIADFGDLNVHLGPGHVIQDLYSLAETDLLIGPPSTYSGWASFYGETPLVVMWNFEDPIDVEPLRQTMAKRVAKVATEAA